MLNRVNRLGLRYVRLRRLAGSRFQRGSDRVEQWLPAWASPPLILLLLLALGLVLRLWGLATPPLEFHPARQFMGATIARFDYLSGRSDEPPWRLLVAERNRSNQMNLEPHIMEWAAVSAYRLAGREVLWIPRALSVGFWLLGAVLLYRIGSRLASPPSALLSVVFFLFMPFGILASRSFQSDPLMICLQLAGLLGLLHFAERESAARILMAAGLCAAAVFVKPVCLFVLGGCYGIGSLRRHGLKRTLTSPYTLLLGAVLCLPVAYYLSKTHVDTASSDLASQAAWSIVPALLLTHVFWHGLAAMMIRVVGIVPLLLGLVGFTLLPERRPHQGALTGIWLGYAVFALTFTFHTHTHDYYHLQVLPISALCLGPLALAVVGLERRLAWLTTRVVLAVCLLIVAAGTAAGAISLLRRDQMSGRQCLKSAAKVCGAAFGVPQKFLGYLIPGSIGVDADIADAVAVGQLVQHIDQTVFLGKDGGAALTYLGEFSGVRWPTIDWLRACRLGGGIPESADRRLMDMLSKHPEMEYFVVSDFGDLAQQPDLERALSEYPVLRRTPRYAVYSLRR